MVARFLDGLPHGAYFGVASLVAAEHGRARRKGRAVALVMLGLSVANVVGVPGRDLARPARSAGASAYWAVAGARAGHRRPGRWPSCRPARATRRRPAAASCGVLAMPQVWLTLLAGAIGFGGMFAVYSYIAPTVTDVGGLSEGAVPVFLLAFGLGMVAGTWLAGELADWSVFRSLLARLGRAWP